MEALEETKVESRKVRKYLPDFLKKLREDLRKELRGKREHDHNQPATQVQTLATTGTNVAFAYQALSQTTFSLHS